MEYPASNNDSLTKEEPPAYGEAAVLPSIDSTVQPTVQSMAAGKTDATSDASNQPSAVYPSSTPAVMYPVSSSHTEHVTVVTSQPQSYSHPHSYETVAISEKTFVFSILCCMVCFFCGSPLTVICFLPAIYIALQAKTYAANGESEKAKRAMIGAWMLVVFGVLLGILIVVLIIVSRAMRTDNREN